MDGNDVATAKRSSFLVSTIGPKTYAVLRSLLAPDTPQSKPYKTLVEVFKKHYEPKPLIIADATCNYCYKKGHIAPACLKKKNSAKNMKFVAVTSDESDSDRSMNVVECSPPSTPIMVTLAVDRRKLAMEVDTGAAYSVISEETY